MRRLLSSAWVSTVILFIATSVAAQETVELSKDQLNLNNQAIRALQETPPDTERALKLVKAAMLVGTDNQLLKLTLGRVHQLRNECSMAESAFGEVLRLPAVEGVPGEVIEKRLALYRSELAECYGRVDVTCERSEITKVTVGDEDDACGKLVLVDPGKVRVISKVADEPERVVEYTVTSQKAVSVDIALPEGLDQRAAIAVASSATVRSLESASSESSAKAEALKQASERAAEVAQIEKAAEEKASTRTESGLKASGTVTPEPPLDLFPGFMGSQVAVAAPAGGFAAQNSEGFSDGGVTYGARLSGIVGYQWSSFVAADAKLTLGYRQSNGFQLVNSSNDGNEELNERVFQVDFDPRFWLDFLGVGPAFHYRLHALQHLETNRETSLFAGGLTVLMSTQGIQRGNGYFKVFARWLPLFVGSAQSIETGLGFAGRFASFDIAYSFMDASNVADSNLRKTETLLLTLGFKIPIASPLPIED